MNNNLKNALITEVEEEINYIQNKLKEKDYINKNEIVFLNKVLDKYNDELLLTDIDIEFFIIFVLYFYNKEKSFDDLFCEIKDLKMDYSNFIPSMVEILEDLSVLFENGIYQKYLKPLKEEPSTKEKEKILEEINKEYDENYSKEFYNYFVNFEDIFDNFIEMQKFIEYLNVDENIVLLFAYYAQELGIKLAGFGYSIKDCLITVVSGNEIKEEKTLFQIKKEYGVDVFISQTSKRLSELEKSERKYYNQLNKSLEDYNKILSLINSEKIITLDKKLNISESILYLLNEYIFKHNLRIYESINGKEIHEIEKLFLSYKLNINKINEKDYEKIKNSKNNNLDRKLYYLTQK